MFYNNENAIDKREKIDFFLFYYGKRISTKVGNWRNFIEKRLNGYENEYGYIKVYKVGLKGLILLEN